MKKVVEQLKKMYRAIAPGASMLGGLFHLIAAVIYVLAAHGWL